MAKKVKNRAKIENFPVIKEDHRHFIDEYYTNGFSGVRAALKTWPELSNSAARTKASLILKSAKNKEYIRLKQLENQEAAKVTPAELAKELKQLAFSDVTVFLGKSTKEISELPSEIRRCLSKVTIKENTRVDKDGTEYTETTYQYHLKDSLTALEKLARHIGFYEVDNRQRGQNVNILNILAKSSPETLNKIEEAMRTIEINPDNQ